MSPKNYKIRSYIFIKRMKTRKRIIFGTICLISFVITLIWTDSSVLERFPILGSNRLLDISCYSELSSPNSIQQFNISTERQYLANGQNIFFHETSCFRGEEGSTLNARQACAVESAARMNPHMTVYLLFLSPTKMSSDTKLLANQLHKYRNVKIRRVFIQDYIKNTPLEQWYASGILSTSYWPRSHMSDIMRYLTLWKYGGIYLDLDVVVTSSLQNITNFAGAEDWMDVAAGAIGLGLDNLGREVANICLQDLKSNFRGDVWGNNGPGVITRSLQKLCAAKYANEMSPERCKGFKVYSPASFYPIFYKRWQRYFDTKDFNDTMQKINKAKVIHVWNKLSSSEPIKVGSHVPYALTAEKFCPRIYSNCGVTF